MQVVKVKVIKSYNLKELEEKIKNLLNKNYKIEGSLIATPDKVFYILMIK